MGLCRKQQVETDWMAGWGVGWVAAVGVKRIVSPGEVWSWKHPDFWEWLRLEWE